MIPGNANPLLLASAAAGAAVAADITKSLRFNSGDSAYLNRTPSSAGNRRTFTFACWIKRAGLGASHVNIFAAGSNRFRIALGAGDGHLQVYEYDGNNFNFNKGTGALFRDPSAWYHLVVAIDTTDATAADRVKVYVNGSRITDFSTSDGNPSQNLDTFVNNTSNVHYIGTLGDSSNYLDAYLADVYFIDGSQLEPTSFGAYDSNGVWQAAAYSGTFGTNGFHLLDFENESTVGHDSSGNENDFTANNITALNTFSTNMTPSSTAYPNTTLSNGGLTWSGNTSNDTGTVSSVAIPTNKKTYVEVTHTTTGGGNPGPGVANGPTTEMGLDNVKAWWRGGTDGSVAASTLGSFTGTNTSWSNGDVLGIALDHTANSGNGSITFYKNGTQIHTGGSGWTSYTDLRFEWQNNGTNTSSGTWNYGASSFSYPVSGHTGLFESTSVENVLFDVPTNGTQSDTGAGGEVSGNYATFNPLSDGLGCTVSNGNLQLSGSATSTARINGTIGVSSGKWYFEVTYTATDNYTLAGVGQDDITNQYPGQDAKSYAFDFFQGKKYNNGSQTTYGSTLSAGDIFMCALDLDNNKIFFGKNGTFFDSGNPATGANPSYTITAGTYHIVGRLNPSGFSSGNAIIDLNAGQRAYAHSAPSGFKSWNTTNLPTPTIADGSDYFDVLTWTGANGGTTRSFTGLSFSPDFVWTKVRNLGFNHQIYDSVRGAGNDKSLASNDTSGEPNGAPATYGYLSSFDSAGFTFTKGTSTGDPAGNAYFDQVIGSAATYVGWCWDAGSSTVSNTDGDVTSSVRANTTAGFSIVTWNGTASGQTVGHGLGAAPEMIIVKSRDQTQPWVVYHSALGRGGVLQLHSNAANITTYSEYWGTAEPSSTVFGTYTGEHPWANNYDDMVAYCISPVAGYSAVGSYTGNGSTDGTFVALSFRPAWVMVKSSSATGNWRIWDSSRDSFNQMNESLHANEATVSISNDFVDFLSNGFKLRSTSSHQNTSGTTYVYLALAENPFSSNGGLAR